MNNAPKILNDALDAFCAFEHHYSPDSPRLTPESDYFLDFHIALDCSLDDFDLYMIAHIDLDDELHRITLLFAYRSYDAHNDISPQPNTLRHLTLLADTDYSNIPLDANGTFDPTQLTT